MKRIGEDALRCSADIGTCVVDDVALNRQTRAVPAHTPGPPKHALDRVMHARSLDPADVIALVAAREPHDLRIADLPLDVAAVRGVAIGDHERLRRIDALERRENRIQTLVAGSSDDDYVELRATIAAAAHGIDHRLQTGRLRATAREVEDRAVKFRMDVGRIAGEVNLELPPHVEREESNQKARHPERSEGSQVTEAGAD